MSNFLSKFFTYKLEFKKPYKIDIILLDDNYANLKFDNSFKTKVKKNKILNFYVLLKTFLDLLLFKGFNLRELYFKKYVESFDPTVAIGHEYNGHIFRFKNLFPNKKSIIYQIADQSDLFINSSKKMISKNFKFDLVADYFLVKNEYSKEFYKFINSKFLITGSIKNNEIILEKKTTKKYDIMFISQFRSKIDNYSGTNNNFGSLRTIDSSSSYVIKILKNISKKYNKNLAIALACNRNDKKYKMDSSYKQNEINFFERDFGKFSHEDIDSISLAEKSELIITINSTLGFELLSRGMKVLFLDIYHYLGKSPLQNIVSSNSGYYWYLGNDKKVIEDKIIEVLKMNRETWRQVSSNNIPIKFDKNNLILKDLVKNLIN